MSQVLINFSKNFFEAHCSIADGVTRDSVFLFNLTRAKFLRQKVADDDPVTLVKPRKNIFEHDLRNDLITRGKYTDVIDELIIKFTKAKVKKIKIKEV